MTHARPWGTALVAGAAVVALAALELAVASGLVGGYLLPSPLVVLRSFPMLVSEEGLVARCASTLSVTLLATLAAALLGGPAGWVMVRWPVIGSAFHRWAVVLAALPISLFYPLALVFLGRGVATILVMGMAAALPPIILSTCDGVGTIPRVLLVLGQSLRLSARQRFRLVEWPAARPALMRGLRLGLIAAFLTVVGTEYLTASGGLGELLSDLTDRYQIAALYGTILSVIVLSSGMLWITTRFERSRPGAAAAWRAKPAPAAAAPRLRWAALLGLALAWEAAARSGLFYRQAVPSLSSVGEALVALVLGPGFWTNVGFSALEILAATLVGGGLGLVCGLALGRRATALHRAALLALQALAFVPKIVLFPLLLLVFGIGVPSKIALGAIAGFFPMAISTASGLRQVDPRLVRLSRSLRLSRPRTLWTIELPAVSAAALTGLRIAFGDATAVCILAEYKISDRGVGFMIMNAYAHARFAELYAATLAILILAALATGVFRTAQTAIATRGFATRLPSIRTAPQTAG